VATHTLATLDWEGELRFSARSGSGHTLVVDSPGRPEHHGASPMELMLIGVAGCTAIDIVAILGKMRQPLASLAVAIRGERVATDPKYFAALDITYRLKGRGLTREKVERAVELSRQTYCSALASLRPDCRITSTIEIDAS
jgi:putative redox protein